MCFPMSHKVAVVNYNAGNIRSVLFALERMGVDAILSDDPEVIKNADKVIFPGVGQASTTMAHLRRSGMAECIRSLSQPVLAICIGQQLLCRHSQEGDVPCIAVIDTEVKKFDAGDHKVPHMGWNQIYDLQGPLFVDIEEGSYVYFVHSYYVESCEQEVATCDYILPFAAAMQQDNFFTTQFHPEKSAAIGQRIFENFIKI